MRTLRLRRFTPLFVLGLLLILALPLAAQQADPAQPSPDPVRPAERQVCVPAGLALAVLTEEAAVAEILPPAVRDSAGRDTGSAADTAEIRIVVPAPAVVGACADFQGFWGVGAAGVEAARLLLYKGPEPTAAGVLDAPVARDGLEMRQRGPYRHQQQLRALTKLTEPGEYTFVAVLNVEATGLATSAAAATVAARDAYRMRFVVVVRGDVAPVPRVGTIEGTVWSADGQPLAGAVVSARGPISIQPARSAGDLPVIVPEEGLLRLADANVDAPRADPVVNNTVRTDEKGHYSLKVAPGQYLVQANARGFEAQWFEGAREPRDAKPVPVKAGAVTGEINFKLTPAPSVAPEPQPVPMGAIAGRVVTVDGTALAGAMVHARPVSSTDPNIPRASASAATDAEGRYALKLPVGDYLVVAMARGYETQWYQGVKDANAATKVPVKADAITENIDFILEPAAAPVPPEPAPVPVSGIAGLVLGRDGQPLAGATVNARLAPLTDPSIPGSGGDPGTLDQNARLTASAVTDREGQYVLRLRPGEYVVLAQARGYAPQWYNGVKEVRDATPVPVEAEKMTEHIDFRLEPIDAIAPVDPARVGTITGVVTAPSDQNTVRARILAIPAELIDPDRPFEEWLRGAIGTGTDESGVYKLALPPGKYVVVAMRPASSAIGGMTIQYYDHVTDVQDATIIEVRADEVVEGIDFDFP